MKKVNIGWLLIALGLLTLSVELYLLPIMQDFDLLVGKGALTYLSEYFFAKSNCILSLLLDIAVVIMGVVLVYSGEKSHNEQNQSD